MAASFPEAARMALVTCTRLVCNSGGVRANVRSHLIKSPSRRLAVVLWEAAYCWRASDSRSRISAAPDHNSTVDLVSRLFTRYAKFHQFALQSRIIGDLTLQAAGYVNRCRGDEAGKLAAQKQHHDDHIFGLTETTKRHDLGSHRQKLLPGDCRAHLPIVPIPLTGIDPPHIQGIKK